MNSDAPISDDEPTPPAKLLSDDLPSGDQLSPSNQVADYVPPDALTLATVAELERAPEQRTWVQGALLLGISLALFALTGIFKDKPGNIALTIGVLLLHELGHYAGMRLFNYQDVRMFFIPFFGAAVAGRSRSVLGYKEAIVLLLGPLPGIVLGTVLGIACLFYDHDVLRFAALLLLVINAFNLLPFLPLDGGRLLHLVLFSRQPLLEAVFRVVTGGFMAWFGWATGSWILGGLGVFMIIGTRHTYGVSRLAQRLRGPLLTGTEMDLSAHIPREQAIPLVELTRQRFPQLAQPKLLANSVRQIWERIHLRPPGFAASLVVLALTGVGFLAAPLVLIVLSLPITKVASRAAADGSTTSVREVRVWGSLREATELDRDNRPHGRHVEYYLNTPHIQLEGAYQNGLPEGSWTEFAADGQVQSIRHYRQGLLIPPPPADADR
jgi:Zn-dependent protease